MHHNSLNDISQRYNLPLQTNIKQKLQPSFQTPHQNLRIYYTNQSFGDQNQQQSQSQETIQDKRLIDKYTKDRESINVKLLRLKHNYDICFQSLLIKDQEIILLEEEIDKTCQKNNRLKKIDKNMKKYIDNINNQFNKMEKQLEVGKELIKRSIQIAQQQTEEIQQFLRKIKRLEQDIKYAEQNHQKTQNKLSIFRKLQQQNECLSQKLHKITTKIKNMSQKAQIKKNIVVKIKQNMGDLQKIIKQKEINILNMKKQRIQFKEKQKIKEKQDIPYKQIQSQIETINKMKEQEIKLMKKINQCYETQKQQQYSIRFKKLQIQRLIFDRFHKGNMSQSEQISNFVSEVSYIKPKKIQKKQNKQINKRRIGHITCSQNAQEKSSTDQILDKLIEHYDKIKDKSQKAK